VFSLIRPKVFGACAVTVLLLLFGLVPTAGAATDYMLIDAARLASLPTSGTPYTRMKNAADNAMASMDLSEPASSSSPWLTNYGDPSTGIGNGAVAVAAGLVYARTGDVRYRDFVIKIIRFVIGSEDRASTNGTASDAMVLATMRQIPGYVLAADLVKMDPNVTGSRSGYKSTVWKTWLGALRTKQIATTSYRSIVAHSKRASNWGAWASAARVTIDVYLNDTADLAVAVNRLKLYLGESMSGSWLKTGAFDASWACVPAGSKVKFVPVNPSSCGAAKDGIIVEDASRSASSFPTWDMTGIDYSFHAYMAQLVAAVVLDRQGYDVWNWGDRAFKRIMDQLNRLGVATGNGRVTATHVSWITRHFYGVSYPTVQAQPSDTLGYTDWLYAEAAPPPPPPTPAVVMGNNAAGTVWTAMSTDRKRASQFPLASTSTVTSIKAYVDGAGATTGSQPVRGVLYSDRSGLPDVPLATSTTVNVTAGQARAWVTLSFASAVRLASGNYWLGLHSGGTTGVARYAVTGPNALRFNNAADAFSDGSSNPFGAVITASKQMSITAIGIPG